MIELFPVFLQHGGASWRRYRKREEIKKRYIASNVVFIVCLIVFLPVFEHGGCYF